MGPRFQSPRKTEGLWDLGVPNFETNSHKLSIETCIQLAHAYVSSCWNMCKELLCAFHQVALGTCTMKSATKSPGMWDADGDAGRKGLKVVQ